MDAHALDRLDFPRVCELLASYALSALGRALAGHIVPVTRADLIQRWHNQIIELQRLQEQRGLPPFGGISDVREIIRRCAPPLRVGVEEVARVGDALAGTHAVAQYLADLPEVAADVSSAVREDYPELRHLAKRIGDFGTIAARIRAVIDERSRVRDEASPKLQRIRRDIEAASREIGATVERLLRDPGVRRLLQYPNPTFHNDRTVLPVRTEYRGRLPGIIHRTSDSGATLYVEPSQVVELNNQISHLRADEQEEINRLLWELAHEIHLNSREILKSLDALAVLDLIAAKVRFARDFELRCPELDDRSVLNVRQARHPLLVELFRQQAAGADGREVVPIDYRLGDDFDLLIVTGPNTGGKTVALKTMGLISLMVQAGLPVPVGPGSSIGIFQNVLIDAGDEQSMQQSLSTFSAHLTRLLDMLRRANPRTLVLIDELGAGTDPDEGAAIGKAILDELLRLKTRCAVSTHLGALKSYALTRPRAENASVEFDIQTLRPTFHLRIGESGSSNAIDVAHRLGMPKRLVTAARRNLSRNARALRAVLREASGVKRQAEQARQAAETARLEAEQARGRADAARSELQQQQRHFRDWVQRVVHLQPGDAVRVRNFDRDGRIVRLRLEQQRAEVDMGAFAVEVPLGDVLPPETFPPPPSARPQPAPARPAARAAQVADRTRSMGDGPTDKTPTVGDGPATRARSVSKGPPGKPAPAAPPRRGRTRRTAPRGVAANVSSAGKQPPPAPPEPSLPELTAEQAEQLNPGDLVYVRRFRREGRVVRVKPNRKEIIVTVGLVDVEVPYDGLALPRKREAARPRSRPASRAHDVAADVPSAETEPHPKPEVQAPPALSDESGRPDAPSAPTDAPTPEP